MTPTTRTALAGARWRKSSHSGDEGACVQMAVVATGATSHTVAVRDSKDPRGPVLRFSPTAWTAFTEALPQPVPVGYDEPVYPSGAPRA